MTFADNLRGMKAEIEQLLRDFILNFTSIEVIPSERGDRIVFIGSSYWLPLKQGGKPAQTTLLIKYRDFYNIIKAVTTGQPAEDLKELELSDKTLHDAIEQSTTNLVKSTDVVLNECVKALDQQIGLLAAFAHA